MLNKNALISEIKTILMDDYPERPSDPDRAREWQEMKESIENKAEQLANAIDNYVRGLQITILSGEIVTAGSPSTQTNANPVLLSGPSHIG